MKPTNRTSTIGIRVKPAERKYIEREAAERGQRISDYLRNLILPNGVMLDLDGKIKA